MKPIFLLFSVVFFCGCRFAFNKTVDGNGDIKKVDQSINDFTGVEVAGNFQVTITQGSTYQVSITTDENLMEYIEIEKHGQNLEISEKDNYNLKGTKGIQIAVQMPVVNKLSVSGSGLISASATLKNDNKISTNIAGSGKIQAELNAPEISTSIAGSGTATLSGQTRKMDVSISGSGDCLSEALKSENCSVTIGGSGTAKVYASQSLDVSIGGSGDVYYAGQPKINQSIAGSGKVRQL